MSISDSNSVLLSPSQTDALKALREQLFAEGILHEGDSRGSIATDNRTLLQAEYEYSVHSSRFLRARKFDVGQTKKMIENCQHWRKTVLGVGIDELNNRMDPFNYPGREEVFKSWSMYFHKTDKTGRPVNIQFFGALNLPELYERVPPEELVEFFIVNADALTREVLPAACRAAGRHVEQSLVIVDLKDFGLSKFWQVKSLVQTSFQISQDYYPETMGQLVIINAPSSFTFIWSIVKPWLSKATVEKVDILGKNYEEVLLQLVEADNLPAIFGGNCTCSNAGGCELSSAGPWMDDRLAERTMSKERTFLAEPSESTMPNISSSERTSSTGTGSVEPANVIHEKVIHRDSTAEVVTQLG